MCNKKIGHKIIIPRKSADNIKRVSSSRKRRIESSWIYHWRRHVWISKTVERALMILPARILVFSYMYNVYMYMGSGAPPPPAEIFLARVDKSSRYCRYTRAVLSVRSPVLYRSGSRKRTREKSLIVATFFRCPYLEQFVVDKRGNGKIILCFCSKKFE